MVSAPGCWQAYGEVAVRAMQEPRTALRHSHVDCFAAQHPTDAATERRQRQSVAVHLVALCLRLEHHRTRGVAGLGPAPRAGPHLDSARPG